MTNDAWGSLSGFTSEKKVVFVPTTFTHPALAANDDGNYQVRLKGTSNEVTLSKKDHLDASITLNEGTLQTTLVYNDDLQVDYDALRTQLFAAMVASTTPQLTADDVTFEYYAEATSGSVGSLGKNWVALEGGTVAGLKYPAMGEGTHQGSRENLLGKQAAETDVHDFSMELRVNEQTPKAFIALSSDDRAVPPGNSLNYATSLGKAGIPYSLHVYPIGGHGWGFRDSFPYKRQWTGELEKWLREINQ